MTVVTTSSWGLPFTEHDLAALPDDGRRHEIIDGVLIVTPSPVTVHQRCVVRLLAVLFPACPEGLEVLVAPFDVRLADDTVIQPDVLVCRRADLTDSNLPVAPVLAVEVLSPSTRLIDLNLKRSRLERAGCRSYWVVDPEVPSLTAWDLVEGAYVEVGRVEGGEVFEPALPYPVRVVPGALVA